MLLFDQRGCGRSTPHAEISHNTTWDLVEDIERLRKHIGVSKWLVFGGSWGSSLALVYSETHPQQVSEIILRGVYTVTEAELNWYYQFGVSQMFLEEWEAFLAPVPVQERHNMIAAYHKLLTGDDVQVQLAAAKAWTLWEGKTTTLLPDAEHVGEFTDDHFAIAFAGWKITIFITGAGWRKVSCCVIFTGCRVFRELLFTAVMICRVRQPLRGICIKPGRDRCCT